jgi:hypothetical protein
VARARAWFAATFTKPCACPALDVRIERVAASHLLECGKCGKAIEVNRWADLICSEARS